MCVCVCDLICYKETLLSKDLSHDLSKGTTVKTPQKRFSYTQLLYIYIYTGLNKSFDSYYRLL